MTSLESSPPPNHSRSKDAMFDPLIGSDNAAKPPEPRIRPGLVPFPPTPPIPLYSFFSLSRLCDVPSRIKRIWKSRTDMHKKSKRGSAVRGVMMPFSISSLLVCLTQIESDTSTLRRPDWLPFAPPMPLASYICAERLDGSVKRSMQIPVFFGRVKKKEKKRDI